MVTAVVAITLAGLLYGVLAAVLVYLAFLILARLGLVVPLEIVGILALIVFLLFLFGFAA